MERPADPDAEWHDPDLVDVLIVNGRPYKLVLKDEQRPALAQLAVHYGLTEDELLAKIASGIQADMEGDHAG